MLVSSQDVTLRERIYEAPMESMWAAEVKHKPVTVLKLKRLEEEIVRGLNIHETVTKDRDVKDYFVMYLGADASVPKIVIYEPLVCQLGRYIETHRKSRRSQEWFYKVGLPVLLFLATSLRLLHSKGIVHGNISLSSVFLTHSKMIKLGDFRLARRCTGSRNASDFQQDVECLCCVFLYYLCNSTSTVGIAPGLAAAQELLSSFHPDLFEIINEGARLPAKALLFRLQSLELTQSQQPSRPVSSVVTTGNLILENMRCITYSGSFDVSRATDTAAQFVALREELRRMKLTVRFF